MSTITWTDEQLAVFDFTLSRPENGIVEALAGSAKSTTLVESVIRAVNAKTISSIVIVAFNKKIAEEMREKLSEALGLQPGDWRANSTFHRGVHLTVSTTHSHGYAALRGLVGSSVKLSRPDGSKRTKLLRKYIESVESTDDIAVLQEDFNDIRDAIGFGAQAGYIPEGTHRAAGRMFVSDEEFFDQIESSLDWTVPPLHREAIRTVSDWALTAVFREGSIDFDDMILIPALFPATFKPYDLTLVDEAQDLSSLQHQMLRKMVPARKRIIAVGDSCQAIYGFRGAHEDSMDKLRTEFNMERLTLSTSFRCPVAVAEHVRWRAPFISSPSWAKPGEIINLETWTADSIPDGSAIICRNNAPLFGIALRLLRSDRRPFLMGNDIVKALTRDMKSLSKDETIEQDEALRRLEIWFEKNKKKYNNSPRIHDKYHCIRMFLLEQPTLGLAIAQCERIEHMKGTITLCTGHKSKGLEWKDVFFLDESLVGKRGQDPNLRYVICTRAKERLIYVTSKTWTGPDFVDDEA